MLRIVLTLAVAFAAVYVVESHQTVAGHTKVAATLAPRPVPLPTPAPALPPISQAVIRPPYVITNEKGGNLIEHQTRWKQLAESGVDVEVRGPCWSACTLIVGHVPKERVCFGKNGLLAFHSARYFVEGTGLDRNQQGYAGTWHLQRIDTQAVYWTYPKEIRAWMDEFGGWQKLPFDGWWMLTAY